MTPDRARTLLGLAATYTGVELRTAFRREAKRLHPDTGGPGGERFREIVEAHELLRGDATTGSDAIHNAGEPHGDVHRMSREPEIDAAGDWHVRVPQEFVQYSDVAVDCGDGWAFIPYGTTLPCDVDVQTSRGRRTVRVRNGRDGVVIPGSVLYRRSGEQA